MVTSPIQPAVILGLSCCLLLTGCMTHYDMTLTNGDVVRAKTRPKLNEDGFYVFQDLAGRDSIVNPMRVRQIESVRRGSRPSKGF